MKEYGKTSDSSNYSILKSRKSCFFLFVGNIYATEITKLKARTGAGNIKSQKLGTSEIY